MAMFRDCCISQAYSIISGALLRPEPIYANRFLYLSSLDGPSRSAASDLGLHCLPMSFYGTLA